METLERPRTFMIVWSLAPRSASWVPTVCRKRWAVTVARPVPPRPPGRTRPTSLAGDLDRSLEQVVRRQQLAVLHEQVAHRRSGRRDQDLQQVQRVAHCELAADGAHPQARATTGDPTRALDPDQGGVVAGRGRGAVRRVLGVRTPAHVLPDQARAWRAATCWAKSAGRSAEDQGPLRQLESRRCQGAGAEPGKS